MSLVFPRYSYQDITCQFTSNFHFCVDTDSIDSHLYLGQNIDILYVNIENGPRIRIYADVYADNDDITNFDNLELKIFPKGIVIKPVFVNFVLRLMQHLKYPSWVRTYFKQQIEFENGNRG